MGKETGDGTEIRSENDGTGGVEKYRNARERAMEKVSEAVEYVLQACPYFNETVGRFKYLPTQYQVVKIGENEAVVERDRTMSITRDGVVRYSVDFVLSKNLQELAFVILHENYHYILDHHSRTENALPYLLSNNKYLQEVKMYLWQICEELDVNDLIPDEIKVKRGTNIAKKIGMAGENSVAQKWSGYSAYRFIYPEETKAFLEKERAEWNMGYRQPCEINFEKALRGDNYRKIIEYANAFMEMERLDDSGLKERIKREIMNEIIGDAKSKRENVNLDEILDKAREIIRNQMGETTAGTGRTGNRRENAGQETNDAGGSPAAGNEIDGVAEEDMRKIGKVLKKVEEALAGAVRERGTDEKDRLTAGNASKNGNEKTDATKNVGGNEKNSPITSDREIGEQPGRGELAARVLDAALAEEIAESNLGITPRDDSNAPDRNDLKNRTLQKAQDLLNRMKNEAESAGDKRALPTKETADEIGRKLASLDVQCDPEKLCKVVESLAEKLGRQSEVNHSAPENGVPQPDSRSGAETNPRSMRQEHSNAPQEGTQGTSQEAARGNSPGAAPNAGGKGMPGTSRGNMPGGESEKNSGNQGGINDSCAHIMARLLLKEVLSGLENLGGDVVRDKNHGRQMEKEPIQGIPEEEKPAVMERLKNKIKKEIEEREIENSTDRRQKGRGDEPSELLRAIERVQTPKVSLSSIIRDAIGRYAKLGNQRSTYRVASNLQPYYDSELPKMGFKSPLLKGKISEEKRIGFIVDTSGSMDGTKLGQGFNILVRLLSKNSMVKDAVFISVDAKAHREEIVNRSKISKIPSLFVGGGGSDLRPAFERLKKYDEIDVAFVITDMDIEFPQEEPKFRTIVLSSSPRNESVPNWVQLVKIEEPMKKVVEINRKLENEMSM